MTVDEFNALPESEQLRHLARGVMPDLPLPSLPKQSAPEKSE